MERKDALYCSEWVRKLCLFLFSPEVSQAATGNEKVSIWRGVYAPKFILKKSRMETVKALKVECPFAASTLLHEVPQECVFPKARDIQ